MIRTPYRAKGAAQLGVTLPGQAGPFGFRPEPTPEPATPGEDTGLPLLEDQH